MASPHFRLKNGSRQSGKSAASHFSYIVRQRHFKRSDLEYCKHANYPEWAKNSPVAFWQAADTFERANGRTYSELEIALPRELSKEQNIKLLEEFLDKQLGCRHPYTAVIHNPVALDGQPNPHSHVMFSERKLDGSERPPETFFMRANKKNPEKGGLAKDRDWNRRAKVQELRKSWEQATNNALARAGSKVRVNLSSLKAQGSSRSPEPKLGSIQTALFRKGIATDTAKKVLQIRAVASQEQQRSHIRNQLTKAKTEIFRERKKKNAHIQDVRATTIVGLVKQEKRSVYNQLEALEKAQYDLGGFRRRGDQRIYFQATKDSWLQQRRDIAVTSYQMLTEKLQKLKGYEKELLLVGDRTLELRKKGDWTRKEAVTNQEAFDRMVKGEQSRVYETSLKQEQEQGLRLSLKKE